MSSIKDVKKVFNFNITNATDKAPKERVMAILKDSEFTVIENSKRRKVDLLIYKDGKHVASIEVEVKYSWIKPAFPYTEINFPERKKSVAMGKVPVIFCMFNKDLSHYLTVTGDVLVTSPTEEVPNRLIYRNEFFFKVPKTKAIFDDLLTVLRKAI